MSCGWRAQLTPFHGKASPSPHSPPLSTSTSSLFSLALEGGPCCFWEPRGPKGFGEVPERGWALAPGTRLLAQAVSSPALSSDAHPQSRLCVRPAPGGQPGPVPSPAARLTRRVPPTAPGPQRKWQFSATWRAKRQLHGVLFRYVSTVSSSRGEPQR